MRCSVRPRLGEPARGCTVSPMTPTEQLTQRLREIAERLRDPAVGEEEAEGLAREAADLVGKASAEIEAALRETRAEQAP